jgi:DnaK suppressor protein
VETDRARTLLSRERQRLEGLLDRHRAERGAGDRDELADVDQHQADEGSETYDREDLDGRIARVESELAAVGRAEGRLDQGTYGISVQSGEPIPEARLEAVPAAERTAEEEERFRLGERATGAPDGDDRTPLDDPAKPPRDLGEIPLSADHEPAVDPQEEDDEVRLPMPGEAYPGEGGAPDVGRPAPDDPTVDRRYRPER